MSRTGETQASTALLERDLLLAELEHLVRQAGDGVGSLVMVAGEAGAGKTAVVEELGRRVDGLGRVLLGGCDPLTTPRPLSPLLDIAADPEAGFTTSILAGGDSFAVFTEVLADLKGSIRPTVLVLEDVHWADEATLDFLRYIGRRVVDSNALVVCTYREDELGPDHPLRVVLGDLATRAGTKRLSVEPLSVESVGFMASHTGHDPIRLHELTGGNPFFVTEILATGEELPGSVSDAVMARVSRLGAGARRLAEAVSVAPRDLRVDWALTLSGAELDDIDGATVSGVLVPRGDRLAFRHELARSAVEESLPMGTRIALNRRMIDLLEGDGQPDLVSLAHHAARANAGVLVAEYAPVAAREAARRGAHREAARFFGLAIVEAARLDPDQVAGLRIELALELGILDRQDEALEHILLAVDRFRAASDPMLLAEALRRLSTVCWRNSDLEGARAAVNEAIALLEPLGESESLALAHHDSAYLWMLARRHRPALEDLARCRQIAEAIGSENALLLHDFVEATVQVVLGDAGLGLEGLQRAKVRFLERGDERQVAVSLEMIGSGAGEVRRYQVALDALAAGNEIGVRTDEDYVVAYNRSWQARIAFEQGRWDDAVDLAELVLDERSGRGAIAPVTALGALGRVRVRRGDPGAREALQEALRVGAGCEMQHVWSPWCGLAELAWLEGKSEEIPGILEWVWDQAMAADSQWARGEVGFWMWKAGAIDGPPERAAEPFALHMTGNWRESARIWAEIGCPYEEALALAEGDEESRLGALRILDGLEARPIAAMLRSGLREMGATHIPQAPRPETRANPAGLTNRQLEVLGLMMDGLSNSEIAQRLYISKKTAEHHVSAVLSKLGVPTRSKAISRGRELGIGVE